MPTARIAGCTVQVSEQKYNRSNQNYSLYTIAGDGAEPLHRVFKNNHMHPSAFAGGKFSFDTSRYDFFSETPMMASLLDSLKRATQQRQVGA